jgi:4-hydroxy-3-methylbut-2-en-1-yl diphosphate reductase
MAMAGNPMKIGRMAAQTLHTSHCGSTGAVHVERFGAGQIDHHFADTSDTLCYATKENQDAIISLINDGGDLAIIVGGYNSSNTSHLVELCEQQVPAYFIRDAGELYSPHEIHHFNIHEKKEVATHDWLPVDKPSVRPVDIILTAGASCPDALLDDVLRRIVSWYDAVRSVEEVLAPFQEPVSS